jgi:hypothetical protein
MKKTCHVSRNICCLLIVSLIGCASGQPLNTPSGKPEVTIRDASRKDIRDTIVSLMANDGWQVRRVKDNVVVVGRATGNWNTILTYASASNKIPENQITFTLDETGSDDVRVICRGTVVTDAGSGFENVAEVEGGSFNKEAQAALDKLQITMRSMPHSSMQDR